MKGHMKDIDMTGKCGSCLHWTPVQNSREGCFGSWGNCGCQEKTFKRDIAKRKARSQPMCKHYKAREQEDNP